MIFSPDYSYIQSTNKEVTQKNKESFYKHNGINYRLLNLSKPRVIHPNLKI